MLTRGSERHDAVNPKAHHAMQPTSKSTSACRPTCHLEIRLAALSSRAYFKNRQIEHRQRTWAAAASGEMDTYKGLAKSVSIG